jgi:16S rRNA (guanine527-N7)-methyltransferase
VEHLTDLLAQGARSLGLELDPDQLQALEQHLVLLAKWNAKLNLVGPGTLDAWAVRHTLDSLAAGEWLGNGANVVDVGSGAGFPGIPCAIARPAATLVLLEPRANRAAFLQNAIALTRLTNASVRVAKAEAEPRKFQLVLGRAVAPPLEWAAIATRLCAPGGGFVLFSSNELPERLGTAERVSLKTYELPHEPSRSIALYVPRGT